MTDLMAEVVRWLDPAAWNEAPFSGQPVSPAHWSQIKTILVRQGISSYLADRLPGTDLHDALPANIQRWFEGENIRNKLRVQAMHSDLRTILEAAHKSGIAVMPLKGSLLTLSHYPVPHWRPMADLDLLIYPNDLAPMTAVLQSLDYRSFPQSNVYARHAVFTHPKYEQVVFWEGEHPENPQPVEIHTRIQRPFWGDIESPDLTDLLWDSSKPTLLLGSPAFVPSDLALLAHLCIHALQDMLTQKARLVQLLDLVLVAPAVAALDRLPIPQWVYPPLCLADRVFPGGLQAESLQSLSMQAPKSIRQFYQQVSIDGRCGLAGLTPQIHQHRLRHHWDRWKPLSWRMKLVYGEIPYPVALLRHLATAVRHLKVTRNRSH